MFFAQQLSVACNRKRRVRSCAQAALLERIAAAKNWAGTFRQAFDGDIRESRAARRGRRDRPTQMDPWGDSARVSAPCRYLRALQFPLRACGKLRCRSERSRAW